MKKAPQISVIMSVYNQKKPEQLDAAIQSVLQQTYTDFEFIIYNDGSDAEVSAHLQKYIKVDKRIRLIEDEVNRGLAYSLNACIDVAEGKYLARMDDDDICDPDRFMVQYDYMERHPEIAYIGCNAKLMDEKGVWGIRQMPEYPDEKSFLRYSPFIHPTVMIRREVLENENGYNASKETLRCEDYELFMRLWKRGYKGHNIQLDLLSYREERASYKKRKFCYRMDEMRLRYRNFKELGLLFPFGWCYVLRPVVAAFVPAGVIMSLKKIKHLQDKSYERETVETTQTVSDDLKEGTEAV